LSAETPNCTQLHTQKDKTCSKAGQNPHIQG
jgi:hypothetical protein